MNSCATRPRTDADALTAIRSCPSTDPIGVGHRPSRCDEPAPRRPDPCADPRPGRPPDHPAGEGLRTLARRDRRPVEIGRVDTGSVRRPESHGPSDHPTLQGPCRDVVPRRPRNARRPVGRVLVASDGHRTRGDRDRDAARDQGPTPARRPARPPRRVTGGSGRGGRARGHEEADHGARCCGDAGPASRCAPHGPRAAGRRQPRRTAPGTPAQRRPPRGPAGLSGC